MLLYVTTGEARDREVRPLHDIPDSVTALYTNAMREHLRPAALRSWQAGAWGQTPDWRFDRQVIRFALYLKERLGVNQGDRVAVLGPLDPLWLQVDFAVQGLGAVPVGLDHTLTDEQIGRAASEAEARVAVAVDAEAADRLAVLRRAGIGQWDWLVKPGAEEAEDEQEVGLDFVWDRAQVLDTPERAANWRYYARQAETDQAAVVHYSAGSGGTVIRDALTQGEAMTVVRDRLTQFPPMEGDVAYFDTVRVTLATRLAYFACVGDGYSIVTLPPPEPHTGFDVLHPAKLVASSDFLDDLDRSLEALSGLGRARKAKALVRQRLGERCRWVEPAVAIEDAVHQRLRDAGVPLPDQLAGIVG